MEDYEGYETVRQKLIISGISEIENHGIADFSLRRVASNCNVSCAAPYKHFKGKEDFIKEIVSYIHSRWLLLQNQIEEFFKDDLKKQLTEVCASYVKFWIANPNFRSVLTLKTKEFEIESEFSKITDTICTLVKKCCTEFGVSDSETEHKCYVICSLVYGAVLMIDNGDMDGEKTIMMLKKSILKEF